MSTTEENEGLSASQQVAKKLRLESTLAIVERKTHPITNSERDTAQLSVAVIGGGLGGLACALALQKLCHVKKVVVYERDSYFGDRKQGYGLTLTNNPKGALAKLGLLEACVQRDCASTCHWVFGPSGKVLGYYGRDFSGTEGQGDGQRGNLRIPRQDLRQLLIDKLQPGTVQWGRKLTDYEEDEAGVTLRFEGGLAGGAEEESAHFDVVVASDGIRSSVRLLRDARMKVHNSMRYVGVAVILGISFADHALVRRQGFYVLDGEHRLFTMPFREPSGGAVRETMWQLSFSGLSEGEAMALRAMSGAQLLAEAARRTLGWLEPVAALIAQTPEAEVWGTPLYDREPMVLARERHHSSRVTCLGDACHPMSMFKGQGANQALEDGPLLAHWLAGGPTKVKKHSSEWADGYRAPPLCRDALLTRLRCFEREMISRTTPKVQASRAAADLLHSVKALEEKFGFEGVGADQVPALLARLESSCVGAANGGGLVQAVKALLTRPF